MQADYFQIRLQKLAHTIRQQHHRQRQKTEGPTRFIIGVCGIPGSGKSTVSKGLGLLLSQTVVLPMDGFHLPRKMLTQEGVRRRGAAFTFDLAKFAQKLRQIKKNADKDTIEYPDFDHAAKDPVEGALRISPDAEIIIVEGLYVLDPILQLPDSFWDLIVWVDSDPKLAEARVAKRHFECGIEPSLELAAERAHSNDRLNGEYVLQHRPGRLEASKEGEISKPNGEKSVYFFYNS